MKKTTSILLSFLLGGMLTVAVAGCTGKDPSGQDPAEEPVVQHRPVDEVALPGIVKDDPYTWFEVNKETLPSREQCREIAVNMRLNDVVKKLGKPQRDVGYGESLFQFDVSDGSVFTVTFTKDVTEAPTLPDYDRLVVEAFTFDLGIPELYFPQQTTLGKLCPWMEELNAEDVVEVRRESAFIGVAPYSIFKTVSYSTDTADVANACRLFTSSLHAIPQSEGRIDGGGYVRYDFVTSEETHTVTIANHTVFVDGQYYYFEDELLEFASPDRNCFAFATDFDEAFDVVTYGEEEPSGTFQGLGELEFQKYEGGMPTAPRYVLKDVGDVDLLILSPKLFCLGSDITKLYEITGEKDFSDLFSETE